MGRRQHTREIPTSTLIEAYCRGVFPMADEETGRIEWYTADPRAILPLNPFHVPRRLRRTLKQAPYSFTRDTDFPAVIHGCAQRETTWISDSLARSYIRLHNEGFAHSVEVWREGELVGGLYGVHIGGAFFGESVFSRESGAGKAALVHAAEHLELREFQMFEIQMITSLTAQFGARLVHRDEYARILPRALAADCRW